MVYRCLLVDDSVDFLTSASAFLSSEGLDVVGTATNGKHALVQAEALRPDVALVDVQLGKEDGRDVARALAALLVPPRVVLISSHARDELHELIEGSDAVDYLPKSELRAATIIELIASASRDR